MRYLKFLSLAFFVSTITFFAQQPATSSQTIEDALQTKNELTKVSLVKNVVFNNIGPSIMSGRVVDLAVNPDNPTEFLCGLRLRWCLAY